MSLLADFNRDWPSGIWPPVPVGPAARLPAPWKRRRHIPTQNNPLGPASFSYGLAVGDLKKCEGREGLPPVAVAKSGRRITLVSNSSATVMEPFRMRPGDYTVNSQNPTTIDRR